jgi:hypothetical protein
MMPEAEERLKRLWHDKGPEGAISFLESRGYVLDVYHEWYHRERGREPSEAEDDAMQYLCREWDYGDYCGGDPVPEDGEPQHSFSGIADELGEAHEEEPLIHFDED